jgi:hypothetical protein
MEETRAPSKKDLSEAEEDYQSLLMPLHSLGKMFEALQILQIIRKKYPSSRSNEHLVCRKKVKRSPSQQHLLNNVPNFSVLAEVADFWNKCL